MRYIDQSFAIQTLEAAPWDLHPGPIPGYSPETNKDEKVEKADEHRIPRYTLIEGVNPGIRISDAGGSDDGNPASVVRGLVLDVDSKPEESLDAGLAACPFKPNKFELSQSGNYRVLWVFQKPVYVPENGAVMRSFLEFWWTSLKCEAFGKKADKSSWMNPALFYLRGPEPMLDISIEPNETYLTASLVESTLRDWAKSDKLDHYSLGPAMPLDKIYELLCERYPNFKEAWDSSFELGAQGPTFWIPESKSPKSAIVHSNGIYTFSASARKGFWTWAELLGKSVVDKFTKERLAAITEGIWGFRKKPGTFITKDSHGVWTQLNGESLRRKLVVDRGVQEAKQKGAPCSEMDDVLNQIQGVRGLDGAAPLLFSCPVDDVCEDINITGGKRILNIGRPRLMLPAPEDAAAMCVWGPSGGFPTMSAMLESLFQNEEQLSYFIEQQRIKYRQCYENKLQSGQVSVLYGKRNTGKSFLIEVILRMIYGGFADCTKWLNGDEDFGSHLFESPLWFATDPVVPDTAAGRNIWTGKMKVLVSQSTHPYHAKFEVPCEVRFCGMAWISVNNDRKSALALPDIRESTGDKFTLFRTTDEPFKGFGTHEENWKWVREEAPYFLRYLLMLPPNPRWHQTADDARYRIDTYRDERVVSACQRVHTDQHLMEAIVEFQNTTEINPDFGHERSIFRGTMGALVKQLAMLDGFEDLAKRPANATTRALEDLIDSKMIREGEDFLVEEKRTVKYWTILKPSKK